MDRKFPRRSVAKKPKSAVPKEKLPQPLKVLNSNLLSSTQLTADAPPLDQININLLYKNFKKTLSSMSERIIKESTASLIMIKKKTVLALNALSDIQLKLYKLFTEKTLSIASAFIIKECTKNNDSFEMFNLKDYYYALDVEVEKYEPRVISNVVPVEVSGIKELVMNLPGKGWATINNNEAAFKLPEWVALQIDKGILSKLLEIKILKSGKVVSIADLNEMRYYYANPDGSKSGFGLKLKNFINISH